MEVTSAREQDIQILVIHVRGNSVRKRYIEGQLKGLGFPYTFITDGNVEDLTPEILDRYFLDDCGEESMHRALPRTSCAYKHILAMEYILEHNLEGALILEDDIRLKHSFKDVFLRSMEEFRLYHADEPFIANYEESSLMLVPRSRRRRDRVLYRATRDRFAGCIYVSRRMAEVTLDYISAHKSAYTSDLLHTHLVRLGKINYYWSYPCIACQCSCDGSMPTMIPTRPRPLKRIKWFYKKLYKHFLYFMR